MTEAINKYGTIQKEGGEIDIKKFLKTAMSGMLGLDPEFSLARGWLKTDDASLVDVEKLTNEEIYKNIDMLEDKLEELGVSSEVLDDYITRLSQGHEYGIDLWNPDQENEDDIDKMFDELTKSGLIYHRDTVKAVAESVQQLISEGSISKEKGASLIERLFPSNVEAPDSILGDMSYDKIEAILSSPWGQGSGRQVIGQRWFVDERSPLQGRDYGGLERYDPWVGKNVTQPGAVTAYDPSIYYPELGGGLLDSEGYLVREGIPVGDYMPIAGEMMPFPLPELPSEPVEPPSGGTTYSGSGNVYNIVINNNIDTLQTGADVENLGTFIADTIKEAVSGG